MLGVTARGYFKSEIDLVGVESGHSAIEVKDLQMKRESRHSPFLARNAIENPASETTRPLATSSLAVGRFAAKKGSLGSPRGRIVANLQVLQTALISFSVNRLCVER